MKKNTFPEWFQLKRFTHVTPKRLHYSKEYFFSINNLLKDSRYVARHAFYPLLHYNIKTRRLEKENGELIRDSSGKIKHKTKLRSIHYPAHLDCFIYSYYAYHKSGKLGTEYEKRLSSNPELSNSICAYRKIDSGRRRNNRIIYKCNIDYAKELFDKISEIGNCCVLTFDIKNFFPSINHLDLKKKWADILGTKGLPDDHYNIFKSLTKFHFIDEKELIKALNLKHKKEIFRRELLSYFKDTKEFRSFILKNKIRIKENPFKYKKGNPWNIPHGTIKGIPQGTPISPLLSNLYLLDFDKVIFNEVVLNRKAFYRRYSDDIAIICQKEDIIAIKKIVEENLFLCKLCLNSDKTKIFQFEVNEGDLHCTRIDKKSNAKKLDYLGFEFDGENVFLKSASLAKFYRKMKRLVALKANRAGVKANRFRIFEESDDFDISRRGMKASKKEFLNRGIFKENIYLNYTNLGNSNFVKYAERAYKITKSEAILKQIKRHRVILRKEFEKYNCSEYESNILAIMELFDEFHDC